MAKRTMTEEQKKRAAENLAKAREAKQTKTDAAPAPGMEVATAAESEAHAVDSSEIPEHEIERQARQDERAMQAHMTRSNKVTFMIPIEPGLENGAQVFERTFNGYLVVVKRGVLCTLPREIVDFIESCTRIERERELAVAEYTSGSGKKL